MKITKTKGFKIVFIVLTIIVFIIIGIGLTKWTDTIEKKQEATTLIRTLQGILTTSGEDGLLKLAGVDVNDIYYSEEGVTIFYGDNEKWFYSAEELQNMSVYEKCNQGVVHITTSYEATQTDSIAMMNNTGSGIVLDDSGFILTNFHVVDQALNIQVSFFDEEEFKAEVIGKDEENDLAIIKIEDFGDYKLYPMEFSTSENLKVGQKVLAIGNPFGYDRTMVNGMISGISRPVRNSQGKVIMGMIQTDAPLNPGNSGGPLLNTQGKVIGINTSTYSSNGEYQGLGFAVPSSLVLEVVPDLIKNGKVERGWIDIVCVQLSPQLVEFASIPVDKGILISQVVPSGKASKAGLKGGTRQVHYGNNVIYIGGDVIVGLNGEAINEFDDLYYALSNTKAGNIVEVTINRNGNEKILKLELVKRTSDNLSWLIR